MPFVISICTSPKAGEDAWRIPLGQQSSIVNIGNNNIPDIKQLIATCPKDEKMILLVTGGHGDIDQGIFNEASLGEWKRWIEDQPKGVFDLIVLDFCDSSALIKEGMPLLLNPKGSIVSSVSTFHGIRDNLIESKFCDIGKKAVNDFLFNSVPLLQGSNLSITKRRTTTSLLHMLFCEESESKIHDSRVPIDLGGVIELDQRKKVIDHVKKSDRPIEVIPKADIAAYTKNLDKQLNPKVSKVKAGLFCGAAISSVAFVALVASGYKKAA